MMALRTRFFLTLLLWLASALTSTQASVLSLARGDFVMQAGMTLPAADSAWTPVTLPDVWKISHPGQSGDGWYRLHFRLDTTTHVTYAVFLPRLCMNAAVFLNGSLVGDGGSFSDPVARNWNRPLFFLIPPSLLTAGENTMYIHVHSPAYSLGNLAPVQIGPEDELRPEYEDRFFLRITLNQATTLIIGVMGLFMLVLWSRRRQDTMYGYFGLSSLIWAFNSSNLFIRHIPVPAQFWETLINASFQVFISLLMIALLRFLGLRKPLLERILWFILIGSPCSLLLLSSNALIPVSMVWHLLTLLSSMVVGFFILRETIRRPYIDSLLLTGALGVNLVFGIHDWLKQASILQSGDTHWIHYGAPVFFLVVGGIMTNRFVNVLNQFEQMNADLERRVAAKHAALEAQYSTMQEVEKQRATMEERTRIFRDLHDDVGAKLLGLAISAERANLTKEADLARSALQDLRDVVSRSAQDSTVLDDLLADWRIETEQRVKAAGLTLDWQFPDSNAVITVSPEAALNLSRIVRESITNILRHAQASHIHVVTQLDSASFNLTIEDNGVGLPADALKPHRGMTGMKARAAAMGASLEWHPRPPQGCRVAFRAPLGSLSPP